MSLKVERPILILGNNVFAHVPEIDGFVEALRILLKPNGRIVLEFPYAADFIEKGEFDTIYHEHVFYFSLASLQPLFERHGLEIFNVEKIPIHGGSLRIFVGHATCHATQAAVTKLAQEEEARGMRSLSYYENFAQRVHEMKAELVALLQKLRGEGKSIAAYGAAAKGSTLLNFMGIDRKLIDFVVDRSPHKQGKWMPGVHIPIYLPARLTEVMPDYALLLTWNFAEEILAQQDAYRTQGGKFIIPLPEIKMC